MTPTLIAAIASAALLVVAGGGWAVLRRRAPARIGSPEEVAEVAARTLPGFVVAGAVVGADGGGALAVGDGNRVAAVARHGKRLLAREVAWAAVRSTVDGVVVETGDRKLGDVLLAHVDVLDIRRLAPSKAG